MSPFTRVRSPVFNTSLRYVLIGYNHRAAKYGAQARCSNDGAAARGIKAVQGGQAQQSTFCARQHAQPQGGRHSSGLGGGCSLRAVGLSRRNAQDCKLLSYWYRSYAGAWIGLLSQNSGSKAASDVRYLARREGWASIRQRMARLQQLLVASQ